MTKHSHFSSLFNTLYSRVSHFSLFYSTAAPKSHRKSWRGSLNSLYRRISRNDPKDSALPILDRWVQEGRAVDKDALVTIIKELRYHKDYRQALEVSMWMSDKRYVELLHADVAIRLDLIAKVHGTEQAENYFNNTPEKLKVLEVYCALLNCYAHAKQLEKAEATMRKMKDLGLYMTSLSYNVLLNLYYKTGHKEKFNSLMSEMEENGIRYDKFTYGIKLNAAAAVSDLEGIDKILAERQSDLRSLLDWADYAIAANGYTKSGAVDKALAMLKISEEQIPSSKRQRGAYEYLMTQYAVLGKKDDTLRLWKCYKEQMKVYNKGYVCIMTSLSKFDDIESAEKIFEEWESEHLNYDNRIPNTLIGAYTRNGFLDKAEAIMSRITLKDQKPSPTVWNYLAKGYLDQGQFEKAVESATKAVSAAQPWWMPNKDVVVGCLEYFKMKADLEGAEKFIKLLRDKNTIHVNMQERLLIHIKNSNLSCSHLKAISWEESRRDYPMTLKPRTWWSLSRVERQDDFGLKTSCCTQRGSGSMFRNETTSDRQTERVNALLELYLRHYVSANKKDWAKLLDVAQFSYNLQRSESTGASPFELATKQQPLTPSTLATGYTGSSPAAYKTAKEWQQANELARSQLEKASKKMKKYADRKRQHIEFQVGDLVFVKVIPTQHKANKGLHKSLLRKYEGPFPILKKVGKTAYLVELPSNTKLHPVFHVSHLKPYHKDTKAPEQGKSHRALAYMTTSFDKEVDNIEAKREVRKKRIPRYTEYFVKWKGLPTSEASWEKKGILVAIQGQDCRVRARGARKDNENVADLSGEECHELSLSHGLLRI